MPNVDSKHSWLDFWLCLGFADAALIAFYTSQVGVSPWAGFASLKYFFLVVVFRNTLFVAVVAAVVAWLASRVQVPVFRLVEGLRSGRLPVWRAAATVTAAAGIGVMANYIEYCYLIVLVGWLGMPPKAPQPFVRPTALDFCYAAVIEEVFFRGIIFAALLGLWRRVLRFLSGGANPTEVWPANILQALIFGAAHVASGETILRGHPWYVRLSLIPVVPQTWDGAILGWLYWKYGIESAIAYHAVANITGLLRAKG